MLQANKYLADNQHIITNITTQLYQITKHGPATIEN